MLCLGIIAVLAARVTTFKIIPSMSLLRVHLCTVPVHRHHVTLRSVPASRHTARRLTLRLQMEKGNTHSGKEQRFERRDAVRRMASAFALGAGVGPAAADSNAAGLRVVPENDMEFHQQWVYSKPQDILPYIYATATKGQPEEVLQAMDEFGRCDAFPAFCRIGIIYQLTNLFRLVFFFEISALCSTHCCYYGLP